MRESRSYCNGGSQAITIWHQQLLTTNCVQCGLFPCATAAADQMASTRNHHAQDIHTSVGCLEFW